jgi:nucleoside-diphosphate-sugar epimerase
VQTSPLVLVTGSAGRLGRAACAELLARGHAVRGFDLVRSPELSDFIPGNLLDAAAVARAMEGVTTLIHLAATPDDADFERELLPNNLLGVHRVLEAARAAGVRRLILASSGQVNDAQQLRGPWPVRAEDPVSPRYWYAATKLFLEAIGRSFAERHGMSVLLVRLGWCPRTRQQVHEIAADERFQDVYLSPGDAGRFFACAVEAPASVRLAVVYATSRPPKLQRLDLEPARRLLGYEPRDTWPQGVEDHLAPATPS